MKICGPGKLQCCRKAGTISNHNDVIKECNCLPVCSSISYDVTATESDFNLNDVWLRSPLHGLIDLNG